ncbi:alpha/beta fold hydrolase [Catenovulum maritimum]|uniref:Acyl-CoA esterase n=1 Tax=Catenovulum maritimum TaxID=1513271 RepID=A0A0J8GPK2_9ALTE|nr:alpha/beta fold hydrolase [Catenovulum maritimum]KMT64712.1 acyl-CoA esterase [Catenovulum maritimum]
MKLNYQISGNNQNKTLVLLHGLFGSSDNLASVAKFFSEHLQVINIDLRNHGLSEHSSEHNYILMAQDVADLLSQLEVNSCYLLGHSMGGKVAMTLALQSPELVEKLIVEDIAPVTYSNRHQDVLAGLGAVDLANLKSRSDADKQLQAYVLEMSTRQFLLKNLVKTDSSWSWKCNISGLTVNYPNVCDFPNIDKIYDKPCLFIKGGQSEYITQAYQQAIVRLFPQAKAKVVQSAGHWIHAEKPAIFNKILADFVL